MVVTKVTVVITMETFGDVVVTVQKIMSGIAVVTRVATYCRNISNIRYCGFNCLFIDDLSPLQDYRLHHDRDNIGQQ